MIVDRLENIGHYACLGPNFAAAVRWLASADLCALEPGTYPIDGENVYATVADNRLERETPAFEAHHLYADIQLILGGEERFFLGWSGRETDPKPERDLYFCEADASLSFTLAEGQFAIFLPGELHAPGNPAGEPSVCRKMVVKVRAD